MVDHGLTELKFAIEGAAPPARDGLSVSTGSVEREAGGLNIMPRSGRAHWRGAREGSSAAPRGVTFQPCAGSDAVSKLQWQKTTIVRGQFSRATFEMFSG